MTWRIEFYHERRRTLASYSVSALTAEAAVVLGRDALRAEHPPARERRGRSLAELAERAGGQDPSGWVLYRIANDQLPGMIGSSK